jgi:hypothetical protein
MYIVPTPDNGSNWDLATHSPFGTKYAYVKIKTHRMGQQDATF